MSTIVTRAGKGAPLTWDEVDANFTNLNTDKVQSGYTVSSLTINNITVTGGTISGITDLAVADGGTGASTASGARLNLGVTATGADTTYAYRANNLSDLANATTARTNLGLGSIATQNANSVSITGGSITGIADLAIADGGTGASTASGARTNLGVTETGSDTTYAYRANNLSDLASASTARTNLGLGSIATQNDDSVAITGGSINNTTIGASTPNTGAFSNLSYTGTFTGSTGVLNIGSSQIYKDASGNVGFGMTPDGTAIVHIAAGSTARAPLEVTSGTLMTTPDGGSFEYLTNVGYFTPTNNNRAVMLSEHFVARTGTKTMTSNTNLQSLFGGGSGGLTNGALTVDGSTSYYFECLLNLSSMSGTSGNLGFSIVGAGTASFTSAGFIAVGYDQTTLTTPAATSAGGVYVSTSALTTNIVTATTGTACAVLLKGIFRINAGGTIIPSIQLTTASAAVIGADTWFKCYPVGTNTVISVGNWS